VWPDAWSDADVAGWQGCIVYDGNQVALTQSDLHGYGADLGVSGTGLNSTVQDVSDLCGPFGYGSASYGPATGSVSVGEDSNGWPVFVEEAGVGVGPYKAGAHGGTSETHHVYTMDGDKCLDTYGKKLASHSGKAVSHRYGRSL
jgi:hypothetical protein